MDKFVPVLRSVLRYEQGNQTVLATILVITLVVIGFFVIKSFPRMKHLDRIIVFMVVFSFTVIFILYLCHNNNYRNNLMTDINQESFVEFYGEFIHDDYQKDSFYHNIYIMDPSGEKILLHYPDYANMYDTYNDFRTLPVGSFVGTIVYGKESKIVVGWSIE